MVIARVASDLGSGDISSPGQVPWTSSSVAPQRRNQGRAASRPVAMRAAPEATVPPIVPIFALMGSPPEAGEKARLPSLHPGRRRQESRRSVGWGGRGAGGWGPSVEHGRVRNWYGTVETFPVRFSTTGACQGSCRLVVHAAFG